MSLEEINQCQVQEPVSAQAAKFFLNPIHDPKDVSIFVLARNVAKQVSEPASKSG